MNKCPNNHCGERHSYVPKGVAHYVCEWCHQAQPDPEVESLRARVKDMEEAGGELLDAYRADVDAGLKHIFSIPPGPDPAFAAERLARAVDAFAVLFNR